MKQFIDKHRKGFLVFSVSLSVFFLTLLLINKYTNVSVTKYISHNVLLILTYIFAFTGLFFYIRKNEQYYKRELEPYFKYAFLILLLIITIGNLNFKFLTDLTWFNTISSIIKRYMLSLTLFAIGTGFFTFYFNRERVEKELEDEKDAEDKAEEKRRSEFDHKFKFLKKFDFSYNVASNWNKGKYVLSILRVLISPFVWIARIPYTLVKWMYKEGWVYSIPIIFLIVIGFAIRLYALGKLGLWWDETITGRIVTRIFEVGVPLEPSLTSYYIRGIAYHYLVVISGLVFGLTEFSLRFPSVVFGMGTVLLSYILSKKINKNVGLCVLLFMTFSTYNVEFSRFARFYMMHTFLFLLATYFIYQGFFNDKFRFKIYSLLVFIIMLFTVQLGGFFLGIASAIFFKIIIDSIKYKNKKVQEIIKNHKKDIIFLIIFLVIYFCITQIPLILLINDFEYARDVMPGISIREMPTLKIPEWILLDFFSTNYSNIVVLLLILGFIYVLMNPKKINFPKYILVVFLVCMILYEFINGNVRGARIFLFFEPLLIIILMYVFFLIIKTLKINKKIEICIGIIITIMMLANISPNFYQRINIDYGDNLLNDNFKNVDVAAYRSDVKSNYIFLKENYRTEDIWINVNYDNYFYIKKTPDYVFNQHFLWNTDALLNKQNQFISADNGAILINNVSEIIEIIDNNTDKKIWIVVNGGSLKIVNTLHVEKEFIDFLNNNEDKVVYTTKDKIGKILLFNGYI